MPPTLVLTDQQKAPLSVTGTDAKGQPATLPAGSVVFATADPTVAAVTDNGDGTAVVTGGNEGTAIVSATFTPGDGSAPVVGQLSVQIVGGAAVALSIVAGAPTAQ
jgi:hypothetical protein